MTRLAGKSALITGAARGIGLAFARGLCREGARVAWPTSTSTAPRDGRRHRRRRHRGRMDVTRQDSIDAAVAETVEPPSGRSTS
jgi:NAD(P)-dependent dehydrogenase (short-subunit alcohol dehydrogenase family)